ncbi:MAG: glycosyltransferase [Defluviitaleaceae bacterium]|nr:glycosyltransferase [Defluviitaleaceae bacterium]
MAEKTVLIIANSFPPSFNPRMGYLSKYIGEYGWNGIAVSLLKDYDTNSFGFLSGYIPCTYIFKEKQKKNIGQRIVHKVKKTLSFFFPTISIKWGDGKKMNIHIEELLSKNTIDIILCSTSRFFPLENAHKIAKKYKIPWVADLKDIYEQYIFADNIKNKLQKKINIIYRNRILKNANMVITVSNKHVEILSNYGINSRCIYNGADTDIFFPTKEHNFDIFKIVYTGRLFDPKVDRDISPIFSVIRQLSLNKDIDYKYFRIQFYTDFESQVIVNRLKDHFCIPEFVDCFDPVPAINIPNILNKSSILTLFMSNKNTGILTTKLFEYLAVGRPILCIWSDEDAVEDIINNSNSGLAAKNEDEIKSFIMSKYNEWLKTGYTNSYINLDYIKNFTRKYNAQQFVELFNSILESK